MELKIVFIGANCIDKFKYANELLHINDNLSLTETFTTDINYINVENQNNIYYITPEEVNLAFKNNVIFYIATKDFVSHGVMIDAFYSNDIFVIDTKDFNNISDHVLLDKNILIVWLDTKFHENKLEKKTEILESKYLINRLENMKYLYFLDETPSDVANVINEYLYATEERQNEILEENS
jgi:hypothetical protein